MVTTWLFGGRMPRHRISLVCIVLTAYILAGCVTPPPAAAPATLTPTAAPTATDEPTVAPSATAEPTEAPTVTPPPTRTGPRTGLGVSRTQLVALFGQAPYDLRFAEDAPQRGLPYHVGLAEHGLLGLGIIGEDQDLRQVSLTATKDPAAPADSAESIQAIFALAELLLPSWEARGEWLTAALDAASHGGQLRAVHDGLLLTLVGQPAGKVYAFSVALQSWDTLDSEEAVRHDLGVHRDTLQALFEQGDNPVTFELDESGEAPMLRGVNEDWSALVVLQGDPDALSSAHVAVPYLPGTYGLTVPFTEPLETMLGAVLPEWQQGGAWLEASTQRLDEEHWPEIEVDGFLLYLAPMPDGVVVLVIEPAVRSSQLPAS